MARPAAAPGTVPRSRLARIRSLEARADPRGPPQHLAEHGRVGLVWEVQSRPRRGGHARPGRQGPSRGAGGPGPERPGPPAAPVRHAPPGGSPRAGCATARTRGRRRRVSVPTNVDLRPRPHRPHRRATAGSASRPSTGVANGAGPASRTRRVGRTAPDPCCPGLVWHLLGPWHELLRCHSDQDGVLEQRPRGSSLASCAGRHWSARMIRCCRSERPGSASYRSRTSRTFSPSTSWTRWSTTSSTATSWRVPRTTVADLDGPVGQVAADDDDRRHPDQLGVLELHARG